MSSKNNKKEENLFHLFIQNADQLPPEATLFPYFEFMDQSIRKKFHQLRKIDQKKEKQLSSFEQFWDDLDNDDKVSIYINWTKLLNRALLLSANPKFKLQPESINLQDQIYIKKTALFQKWQKKNVKLTLTQLVILSSTKNKQYQLKDYEVRKSRSRQNFAWVLQPINNNGKYLQCGVSSQTMFDQWFQALKININNQRTAYFASIIKQEKQNPGSIKRKISPTRFVQKLKKQNDNMKTLTQRMIDRQMKLDDYDCASQNQQKNQFNEFKEVEEKQIQVFQQKKVRENKVEEHQNQKNAQIQPQANPNIFRKLVPEYNSLLNFTDTPVNCALLHCQNDYRIYELPISERQQISTLKYFAILPYPRSLIFQAVTSQMNSWNDEIDTLTIKTKISSENTLLLYEKNKSQGILYRQRDYLYLRHCFSVSNLKQKNNFIVDKSIDSIHHPPFMTVVRAEKQLIWGIIQKQSDKQCLLIVEGWIKGGGYMNIVQNRQMTQKYMKKLINLNGYLKQISFSEKDKSKLLFKQDWSVDMSREEYVERKFSTFSQQKGQIDQEYRYIEKQQQQQQMAQFIQKTNEELGNIELNKSQVLLSDQKIGPQNYIPPPFNKQKFVVIPQQYLKKHHQLCPKQKPKKPKYFPHFRGHHLWKGQWAILPTGGLAYVDEQKMKQQKKVLTFIIKKIGKNIFSGKGILNISLPVDIFCIQSNIERLAMSFGFFPHYLQKAALINQPQIQLKYLVSSVLAGSLVYLTMQKPFNPILGETYQCWIDNCPIYFQQISHHPPIAAFLMKGRGYTVSGCVQAKMQLSINSGTGVNEGVFKVQFDNGNIFYYTTAPGCLSGLTYGERKLHLVGKSFYWTEKGLFLQINYNPASKTKGFFGGVKGEGDQKLLDYFEGEVKQYPTQAVKEICFKKSENRQISIIPKGAPNCEALKTYYKVHGRWNKYVMCGDEKIFDIDENRYFMATDEKYPLPSHSNYRQDIVYRRMKDFVVSQDFKEVLEIKQREDKKQRAKFNKVLKH